MSNVVNNHNKYKAQQNNISRQIHQSINPRGQTPVENHRISYSSAARQGIHTPAHQSHEGVIPKSHPTANTVGVSQVVLSQQPNMASQVSNVNPGGTQMTTAAVANTGSNQMQVLPQSVLQTGAPRYGQPFHNTQHHQPRPQQPRPLLQNNQRTHNPVPNSGVPQAVHSTVQPNMSHYFVPTQQLQTQVHFPNQFLNAQHMPHYSHQSRPMQVQSQAYYPIFQTQQPQQSFAAPQPTYNPYGMPAVYQSHYQPHHQPTAQIMPQVHQTRGPPVSNQPVIQPQQPQMVQMAAPNNEVNETTSIPSKPIQKRTRHLAILTDPNSGKEVNIEDLAKEELKVKAPVVRTNESYSGASTQPNVLPATSPKSSANDVNSIGIEFATKVAVAATEPITRYTTSPIVSESDVSVNTNSNQKPEESVAISSKTTLSVLSETNDKNSDICDNSTDDNNLVINTISTNSVSNSSGIQNDSKQLNKSLAQNSNKTIISQINREINSSEEINENGEITDSCNESVEEKEETIQIEHSTQKVNNLNNNNNRKKEMILKEESIRKSEELIDKKVEMSSDVTDNSVTLMDKIEPQLTSDESSSVINSNVSTESVDKSVKTDIILNNLSENHSEKNDNENNRINEMKNKEVCGEPTDSESAIPSAKTILPDLPYNEDQWTPLNPDGKKHYDRNFLLAIRDKSENSLKVPESFKPEKHPEIIRKGSSTYGYGNDESNGNNLFLPKFASNLRTSDHFGSRLMPGAQINRRLSQQGRHQEKQRKIISTSLTQDVKLHTTDNAWKPTKLSVTTDDPDEKETQELLKKIRGILNKLTPQKYEDLVKQILGFKIDTEDRLKRVLDLVFEKAVDEPAFCIQYANLCKRLSNEFKVMTIKSDNNAEEVKFHKLLIIKCQKEFETEIYASITDLNERQDEIENNIDPQKKKMLKEILDEDMRRARKRSLGNIKLIGELYKLNMLKANIMVQCIDGLLKESDDESLECLCALFRTIGEQIETEAIKNEKQYAILNNFFVKMEKIAEQKDPLIKGTSARVRFMLRDIIDMRSNGWKPRRDENLPKRIDEIHMEIQKEDEQTARELHQHTINRKQEERERKQKGGRNESQEGSQWTTVTGRKSQNASQPNVDWNILKQQQQQNHETVQLGPQSGSWSLGSRGGAQSSQSRFPSDDKVVNRFSPLEGTDARKSSQKSNIPSRDSSKGRSNQPHSYQTSRSQRSQRSDREDAINLARNFSSQRQSPSESFPMYPNVSRNSSRAGSREASAPNSRNSSMRRETPDLEINQLKGPNNISEEELKEKANASISEFIHLNNYQNFTEPVYDVTKYCNESNVHIYISTALNFAFETSSQTQHFTIGKLIDHLLSKNIIQIDHFFKGLSPIFEFAEDMAIDVPKMWDYIGEVLAPIFINLNQNRKKFILELIKMCDEKKRSLLVANIFSSVSKLTSVEKANELWFNSDLNWSEFLGSEQNIEDFVRKNNVEFTLRLTNKSSNCDQNFNLLRKEVESLVRDNKSNDEIQNYISKHFNASQTSDHKFTSALFTGVIRGCIYAPTDANDDNYLTFEKTHLQPYCPLLCKFLGGDPERELQALIALQELIDELQHPSALLLKLFTALFDQAVISQEAFLQWEKSDNNRPGKAVAVKSVTSFFTWLSEADEDDDDNDTNS